MTTVANQTRDRLNNTFRGYNKIDIALPFTTLDEAIYQMRAIVD